MLEVDLAAMHQLVKRLNYRPLFVTVSGAHLYGFPSADSDVDLRGCHQLPLWDVVGLDLPNQTLEHKTVHDGTEVELVSHEIAKYLRLLVRNNGYILEQIQSPIVVMGHDFLNELRPLAHRCITRHHYHHYRGFYATQRKLLDKEDPKRIKPLLYAYRVLMTGIHLLRSGEVEANLLRLNEHFRFTFLDELIRAKLAVRIQQLETWTGRSTRPGWENWRHNWIKRLGTRCYPRIATRSRSVISWSPCG